MILTLSDNDLENEEVVDSVSVIPTVSDSDLDGVLDSVAVILTVSDRDSILFLVT
jgi:hypothetical protein